eukprot:PhM_4_TR5442/c0_g1_i1/m.67985
MGKIKKFLFFGTLFGVTAAVAYRLYKCEIVALQPHLVVELYEYEDVDKRKTTSKKKSKSAGASRNGEVVLRTCLPAPALCCLEMKESAQNEAEEVIVEIDELHPMGVMGETPVPESSNLQQFVLSFVPACYDTATLLHYRVQDISAVPSNGTQQRAATLAGRSIALPRGIIVKRGRHPHELQVEFDVCIGATHTLKGVTVQLWAEERETLASGSIAGGSTVSAASSAVLLDSSGGGEDVGDLDDGTCVHRKPARLLRGTDYIPWAVKVSPKTSFNVEDGIWYLGDVEATSRTTTDVSRTYHLSATVSVPPRTARGSARELTNMFVAVAGGSGSVQGALTVAGLSLTKHGDGKDITNLGSGAGVKKRVREVRLWRELLQ